MISRSRNLSWPAWMLAAAALAALITVIMLAVPPAEAHNEGGYHEFELWCNPDDDNNNSNYVDVNEGDEFDLTAKWHENSGTGSWYAHWDTEELSPVQAEERVDFSIRSDEQHGKSRSYSTFNHTFHTTEDQRWEGNESFKAGYSAIRPSGGDNRHGEYCTINIIDDDTLRVKSVRAWGNPANGTRYTVGETIRLRFDINGKVHVPSDSTLWIHWDDDEGESYWRSMSYNAGLSTEYRPVFDYTVQSSDPKGEKIRIAYDLDKMVGVHTNGTVTDTKPQFSATWLQNFEQQQGTMTDPVYFGVDGRPKVTVVNISSEPQIDQKILGWNDERIVRDYYRTNEPIEVAVIFDQKVEVTGQAGVSIRIGDSGSWRGAYYSSGSGTNLIYFRYLVKASDYDDNGIGVDSGGIDTNGNRYGFTGSGKITAVGNENEVNTSFSGFRNKQGHKVDGRPHVVWTETLSTPQLQSTYWEGEKIEVALNYNTEVDVSGEPTVDMNFSYPDDGVGYVPLRKATYVSGSGTKQLIFAYEVQADDKDTDGFGMWLGGGDFGISGGTVTAAGTEVEANPWYSAIRENADHKVDGSLGNRSKPEVTDVSITSNPGDNGYYLEGDTIQVTVTFDDDLTLTAPTERKLTLNPDTDPYMALTVQVGEEEKTFDGVDKGDDDELVFEYDVKEWDADADGISIAENSLSFGLFTVAGSIGNRAVADHDAVADESAHRVDAAPPTVSSVKITSTPNQDDTYYTGEEILVTVTFNETVTGSGNSQLELDFDGTAKMTDFKESPVNSRNQAIFAYTVLLGDADTDGIAIEADKLTLNGGTIKDLAGNAAELDHGALAENSAHKVNGKDTTPPTISSIDFTSDPGDDEQYGEGDIVEVTVTFTEDVTVTGTPGFKLFLNLNQSVQAEYHDTDGHEVAFRYTVKASDRSFDGLMIKANALSLNGGSIVDSDDNDAVITHASLDGPNSGHTLDGRDEGTGDTVDPDTTAPTVSSVSISSSAGSNNTYGTGDDIDVSVLFDETVDVSGSPYVALTVGDDTKDAYYDSSDGATVIFVYTVEDGDSDTDGVSIAANAINLNGGSIEDPANNDANLDHDAVAASTSHLVDGSDLTPPSIESVAFNSDPGADDYYALNDVIEATVTFSEDVTVTRSNGGDTPYLELKLEKDGGGFRSVTMAYNDTDGAEMTFTYTVLAADRASDGTWVAANALKLNGATIKDGAGNDAVLTHGMYNPNASYDYHQVDGSKSSDTKVGGV